MNSLKRLTIFANKTTHQVTLKLKGSDLNISAKDLDFSNEANERLVCNYKGDDLEIAFNGRFLIDMLSSAGTDEVQFEFSSPSRATLVSPASATDNENLLMLVMPIMVNN